MEYKKSDAESWTVGTGSDITGLVPGTYYVRLKATDTTNASANQELTIKGFISYTVTFKVVNGKWNEGEGDAATADKTVTRPDSGSWQQVERHLQGRKLGYDAERGHGDHGGYDLHLYLRAEGHHQPDRDLQGGQR